ncbi:protein of unknown function [Vibrio tapetis subsp. tapetis]|uniref:Uncharacterized protein n=1 Tax=Vibrio tapetis subsp. tapetis TaxID=1671868 RepID=A0A2N8Z9A5_9VIBR|nr:protein of unknown function [Vibrio tapetis subsp. tapetis]
MLICHRPSGLWLILPQKNIPNVDYRHSHIEHFILILPNYPWHNAIITTQTRIEHSLLWH